MYFVYVIGFFICMLGHMYTDITIVWVKRYSFLHGEFCILVDHTNAWLRDSYNYILFKNNWCNQTWCLGRFLPLLIGDLIPEGNENWRAFLMFLKIMEYTFAPVITMDKLDYLQTLI